MRLQRLDLTRYGKFTGHTIDFGPRRDGVPDFHIVYGPNEAGKSTALAAYLDLLFGIERTNRYNFLHPYNVMQIGAALAVGGRVHELRRIKRTLNTLLDAQDQPVSDDLIRAHLGKIDRKSYCAMFSLDDDTIEQGGDDILASKGDLGRALFSASAGVAGLSQMLAGLREEAEQFHKPRGRDTRLNELKARLAELRAQRDGIDTAAAAHARLVAARDQAREAYEEAVARRGEIQARSEQVQRYLGAWPRLAALRTLHAAIAPLAHLPPAPPSWKQALSDLQTEAADLTARLDSAARDIAGRAAAIDAIADDPAALRLADRVDGWTEPRARAVTARDIPDRQEALRREDMTIAGLLVRLGQAGHGSPADLILPAAATGALRALLESRSGIEARLRAAAAECEAAQLTLAELRAQAGGLDPAAPADAEAAFAALAAAHGAWEASDHAMRARHADRTRAALLATAADELHALLPWRGGLDELAALSPPAAPRLAAWRTALAAAQKRLERQEHEVARQSAELTRFEAEMAALAGTEGVVSDQEAADLRAARDLAWASHRRALDEATADRFEAVLRRDDVVTSARLRHEGAIARLHKATQDAVVARAAEALARRDMAAHEAAVAAIGQEVAGAIAAMTPLLPPTMALAELEAWLAGRDTALKTRVSLLQAERDLGHARADAENARNLLVRALAEASVPHDAADDLAGLAARAQAALRQRAGQQAIRQKRHDAAREAANRQRDLDRAEAADRDWQESWVRACQACWLRDHAVPVAGVREILDVLGDLGPALERRASLSDRVEAMRQDEQAFAATVRAAAAELGMEADGLPPLHLDRVISARVQAARQARENRAARTLELDAARRDQDALVDAETRHRAACARMTEHFGVETLAEVAARLDEIARRDGMLAQAAEAERDIMEALRVATLADAEAALDAADRTTLEAEHVALKARYGDSDTHTQRLYAAFSQADDRLAAVGGDDAVARIEAQRRTILLDIEDKARRYLKLRLGITAAEHALRAYRQLHRGPMMQAASEAFRIMSGDAYSGLASLPRREGEVLVAIAAGGASKLAEDLSKGTRFQLYLALRLAGYEEFARHREPVPFIADDIMETFDDARSAAALRLLSELGHRGQVIYLTHHQHLCDIARATCPGVAVHNLAS
jgi:uncharacterized protein YhaN